MQIPGMVGWHYEDELDRIQREKQKEINQKLGKENTIYLYNDKVYIKDIYFEELAKQMKHRVGVMVTTYTRANGYYCLTPTMYLNLQKYIPLPPWEDLKIVKD